MGRRRTEGKHDDDGGPRHTASFTTVDPSGNGFAPRQESRRWSTADRTAENLRGNLKRRISLSTKLFSGHQGGDRDPMSQTSIFGKKNVRDKRMNRPEDSTKSRLRMVMSAEMYDRMTRTQKQERDHDSMVNQFKLRTTPTGLQGDSMWINFALSSPQGLGMLAPRKHWSPNGWSHAARVALLLTTLGQERDLLTAAHYCEHVADFTAQLREQQILDFMKKSCSDFVLKIANFYQIAAELAELRSLIEDFLQRSNANLDMHGQHEILFPFDSLDSLKVQLEKLQVAEMTDGWHSCVKKCVAQNLRVTNSANDRSLDAMSDQRIPTHVFQPGSFGMLTWETFIVVVVCCQFIMVPFVLSYHMHRHEIVADLVTELFLLIDILVHFNLAYFAPPEGWGENFVDSVSDGAIHPPTKTKAIIVLNRRLIALHYTSSYAFYIDMLSASPIIISMLALIDGRSGYKYAAVKLLKYVRVFKIEQMISVTRRLPRYMFQQHARQSSRYISLLKLGILLLGIAITMHVLACVWHLITPQNHWELRYNRHNQSADFLPVPYYQIHRRSLYLMSYYESILILMGEQIVMSQITEYVFAIISTVLFSFLLAIIFGEVAMFIANFNELPFAYSRKMAELHETMSNKRLPRVLQSRVYAFYDFLWNEHKTLNGKLEIVQFLPELTSNLATEVRLFWCTEMLLNVPLFKVFPALVVQRLVIAVDIIFFMPDDYILVAGEIGHEMFFLKKGKVDVFRVDETEIEISDEFSKPSSIHGEVTVDEQRRHVGHSFIGSAKSTTRSISSGVKCVALQGVTTMKHAMPARKRGGIAAMEGASLPSQPKSCSPGRFQPTRYETQANTTRPLSSGLAMATKASVETSCKFTTQMSGNGGMLYKNNDPLKHLHREEGVDFSGGMPAQECDIIPSQILRNQKMGTLVASTGVRVRRMQREQILTTLKPGSFFGEIALVTCCPRTATVKSRTFVECATILRRDLESTLIDHPNKLDEAAAMVKSRYAGSVERKAAVKDTADRGPKPMDRTHISDVDKGTHHTGMSGGSGTKADLASASFQDTYCNLRKLEVSLRDLDGTYSTGPRQRPFGTSYGTGREPRPPLPDGAAGERKGHIPAQGPAPQLAPRSF